MTHKLSLKDLQVANKKILMRVDFNVPFDKEGHITDDTRIVATLPSIQHSLERGGALILMSHLGRPKGKQIPELSLKPCAKRLATLLGKDVIMAPDCVGPEVKKIIRDLKPGQIVVLENLRFHKGEECPSEHPDFVKQLADLGDVYVNDAFGAAHRAHASTTTIAGYFPDKSAAGLLLEKEIQFLGETLKNPKRPFCAVLGGSKISGKFGIIEALLRHADSVLIGGGMAFTFQKAQGISIGDSIYEENFLDKAKELLASEKLRDSRLLLPQDYLITDKIAEGSKTQMVESSTGIPQGYLGVDIGPKTIKSYVKELKGAATVFWNGPLGVFEIPAFAKGTEAIAKVIAELNAMTLVGGGDSIAALQAAGFADKITHLSTGGGAALEYIEFGTLPGIDALSQVQEVVSGNENY